MTKIIKQSSGRVLNQLGSILKLPPRKQDGVISNGNKYFLKIKGNPFGHYGGYGKYFENLSRIKYKDGPVDILGGGGQRTLNFGFKYMSVAGKILSHPKPLRILDLGCSSGFLRRVLEANVFSLQDIYYYGIDIREDVLRKAVLDFRDIESGAQGDHIPSLYLNYDLRLGLPFRDSVFDFVVSFETTKYLEKRDTRRLFNEINRVLKDGKTFIYSTAGIFENEKIKEMVLKVKGEMVSTWDYLELRAALERNNLFLMKTYGSETNYNALRPSLDFKNNHILTKMEDMYPDELIAAVFGPFYHQNNPTKLFYISKGKPDFFKEINHVFQGEIISNLKHRGNARIFVVGNKIVKYLSSALLEKYLGSYKILKEQTNIKLPGFIKVVESKISENHYLVMEKIEGKLLGDVWESLSKNMRGSVFNQLITIMKQIHSIHFDFENAPSYFKLIHKSPDWRETVREFCLDSMDKYVKNNIISKSLYEFLLSVLRENIDYIPKVGENFVHGDLSLNNLMINKESRPVVLFDFETCLVGDKYLDLFTTSADFEKKDQSKLFKLYGVGSNFDKVARVYRLFLFLRALKTQNIFKEKISKVKVFIEKGGRLSLIIPL